MLIVTQACPANRIGMIEIIDLQTIGVVPAGIQKFVDQETMRGHGDVVAVAIPSLIIVLGAIVVGVKDTGIALAP